MRPVRDVAVVRGLANGFDGREPVVIPSPPERGEARLLAGLLVVCLVWAVLAVVGAVWIGCLLWPHRVGVEQSVFVLVSLGIAGGVGRYVNVRRAGR